MKRVTVVLEKHAEEMYSNLFNQSKSIMCNGRVKYSASVSSEMQVLVLVLYSCCRKVVSVDVSLLNCVLSISKQFSQAINTSTNASLNYCWMQSVSPAAHDRSEGSSSSSSSSSEARQQRHLLIGPLAIILQRKTVNI